MNWKLIVLLTLFGLTMGFATVYFIPTSIEIYVWLMLYLVISYIIQLFTTNKLFLHGFLVSIGNGIWLSVVHIAFINTYFENHEKDAESYTKYCNSLHIPIWQFMIFIGLLIGIFSGIILGLFAEIIGKMFKKA